MMNPIDSAFREMIRGLLREELVAFREEMQRLSVSRPHSETVPTYDPDERLTVEQVAALLHVTPATVRQRILHRELAATNVAAAGAARPAWRVRRADVTRFGIVAAAANDRVVDADIDTQAMKLLGAARERRR
jgi:hypothetical protein